MTAKPIELTTADGHIDGHFYTPSGDGPWPGVVMLTDIYGVRPEFERMAGRLADAGFAVILPNLYHRLGKAPLPAPAFSPDDPAFSAEMLKRRDSLTREGVKGDIAACLDWLQDQPQVKGPKAAIVGYCMSGSMALHTAADFPGRIAAAASFHGGRLATDLPDSPHLKAGKMEGRLLLGYAVEDASMPVEMIAKLEAALTAAGVPFESETYNAKHGFAVYNAKAYDKSASEHHWDRLIATFKEALAD